MTARCDELDRILEAMRLKVLRLRTEVDTRASHTVLPSVPYHLWYVREQLDDILQDLLDEILD